MKFDSQRDDMIKDYVDSNPNPKKEGKSRYEHI